MSQRFEGHNLDEALQHASESLGVERYRLTYHVLVEKRGFLGGVKRVVIEAEVNENPAPAAETPHVDVAPAAQAAPAARERQRDRGPRRERRDERGDRRKRGERHDREDRPQRREDPVEFAMADEIPEQAAESTGAASVRAWCEEALRRANLDVVVRTTENDTQVNVGIFGRDARRLLEHHGEVLDALQVLANKALVGRSIEKDVELDCSSFKERRADELRDRALQTADRVRRERREELLPAMSPIERRIVHLTLQEDPDVTTESRGDGFYKRVAIILRPAQQPAPSEP